MLIGIDASRTVREQKTGTEWYSWYLIRELSKLDFRNNYLLYTPNLPKKEFLYDNSHFQWKIIPPQKLWSQRALVSEVNHNPPDVLFIPSHVIPHLNKVKSVVTIHDLAYKYYPKAYSLKDRFYLDLTTKQASKKATRIIVPSVSTKNDLIKFYNTDENKVTVVYEGVDTDIFKPGKSESSFKNPYILFIGRLEERKNVTLLIKAFNLLAKENTPVELVLIGKPGYGYENIKEEIDKLPPEVKSKIHELGYVPYNEIMQYLQNATVFAFPSNYEGFGLTLLESMACGIPVISSDMSSLPEVAGQAALTLPNDNVLSWASALSKLIHKDDDRQRMIDRGLRRVSNFSWKTTAEKTLEVILDAGQY